MYPIKDSEEFGVLIKDKDFKIGKEVRELLKRGEKVFLVRKIRRYSINKPK